VRTLHQQRPEHLDVAIVCLVPVLRVITTLQQCVQVGTRQRQDNDDGLDHNCSSRRARPRRSTAPGSGWTARGDSLIAKTLRQVGGPWLP
jgi:hypothetical protein